MQTLREVLADFAQYAGTDPARVSIASTNAAGETPLHYMAFLGDVDALHVLAKAGADLAAQDDDGNTPLHVAIAALQIDAANALLSLGAPSGLRNRRGLTPQDVVRLQVHPSMFDRFPD